MQISLNKHIIINLLSLFLKNLEIEESTPLNTLSLVLPTVPSGTLTKLVLIV